MKLYHQINKFFLERYPIIWNTHFIWMLIIGILLHLFYFILGYFNLDYETLQSFSIKNIFYSNSSFGIYVIICLIAFIYFGFRFFTHNPFKNFYPISHLYFWKNFVLLFILLFVFLTVNISFEVGMKVKLSKIFSEKEHNKMVDDINLAYPFLFNDISQYRIDNRVYPIPFPLRELSNVVTQYDTVNHIDEVHGINYEEPYLNFDGDLYQFGHVKNVQLDSCTSIEKIVDYVDVSKVENIEEHSLYNFNDLYIFKKEEDIYKKEFQDGVDDSSYKHGYIEIAPTIHKVYKDRDQKAIEEILSNLVKCCKKYNVAQQLDPHKMSKAVLEQNLDKNILIHTGFFNFKDKEFYQETSQENTDAGGFGRRELKSINYNYYVDMPSFANINRNYFDLKNRTGLNNLLDKSVWAWIYLSMFFSLSFILFKFLQIKELIIGAVISGILTALYSSIFLIRRFQIFNSELQVLKFSIIYLLIIITIGIVLMYKESISKPIATKWFLPTSISIVFLPIVIYIFLYELTAKELVSICGNTMTTHTFEIELNMIFLIELISLFFIFKFFRKLQAKPL